VPIDIRRVVLAAVQAALEEPSPPAPKKKSKLSGGRAILLGAGVVTAGRLAAGPGRDLVESLQRRLDEGRASGDDEAADGDEFDSDYVDAEHEEEDDFDDDFEDAEAEDPSDYAEDEEENEGGEDVDDEDDAGDEDEVEDEEPPPPPRRRGRVRA
jgi:hypothetical protein